MHACMHARTLAWRHIQRAPSPCHAPTHARIHLHVQATGVGSAKAVALWPFSSRGVFRPPAPVDKKKKRILIMMSETGGGHKASAEAIQAGFEERFGTERCVRHPETRRVKPACLHAKHCFQTHTALLAVCARELQV